MKRLALAVGTTLVIGALVPSGAQAAPAVVEYNCQFTGLSPMYIDVSIDPGTFPTSMAAGRSRPAGVYAGTVSVTIPQGTATALQTFWTGATELGGSSPDASLRLGSAAIALQDLTMPLTPINPSGDTVLTANPSTGAFTTPAAGSRALLAPASFSFTLIDDKSHSISAACTISNADPGQLATVTLVKQTSTTKGTVHNIGLGKRPTVSITVTRQYGGTATGTVKATTAGRTISGRLAKGKVTVTLPKITSRGRKTVTLVYGGSSTTAGSRKVLTFRVG